LRIRLALSLILFLWLAYTISQTLFVTFYLREAVYSILEFVPGVLGVIILTSAGLSRRDCYLRLRPLSKRGLVVLIATTPLLIPVLLSGTWMGWNPLAALVYEPASAIAQELFFRSILLPALYIAFKNRFVLALLFHSLLFSTSFPFFSLWHIGPFLMQFDIL
jgi:hypothetical protein